MYDRLLEKPIMASITQYRCLTLVGPRQSGKTTLSKKLFPKYQYFSFENPNTRELFQEDPLSFLESVKDNAIFDEVQKVPQLLSYLQEILDDKKDTRKFILTGSNNLQLSKKVSQSLAGRTKIFKVLPLQRDEISTQDQRRTLEESLFYGSYPRIYDEGLNPPDWLGSYLQTYIEKDIRDIVNISDIKAFQTYLRLLAGRTGQLVNHNSLAADAGITQPTAKSWLSSLETTYICYTLSPHFKNFNKRLIKSPKIYFYDTGLLCYLLRIQNFEQLTNHPLRGAIFENWVIGELMKSFHNNNQEPSLYFWRDTSGHELDIVVDQGNVLHPVEIKSGKTFQRDFVKNIHWFNNLQKHTKGTLVFGGKENLHLKGVHILPWDSLKSFLKYADSP